VIKCKKNSRTLARIWYYLHKPTTTGANIKNWPCVPI